MFAKQIAALAGAVGISFKTPVGKLLGDKLSQSVEEGVQGVQDKQPNDVEAGLTKQVVSPEGGLKA